MRTARQQGEWLAAGGAALAGGGAVWWTLLMRPIWAASAYGPICGHASLLGPHCPPCYAALAMFAAGLGLLSAGAARQRAAVRAR
jgi:hypothetical protein